MPDFDLILRNGNIVDGSGNASYTGDVAIAGDRIAAVGKVAASAKTEIDVSRLAIAPGFIYPPGSFPRTPELIGLARVVARYEGIYTSHIRDEGPGLLRAVEEAIRIGEEAGCGVEISHHKAAGREAWGSTERSLALIAEARARDLDVTVDVYPYTAGSTALAAIARFGDDVFEMPALIASVKYNKEAYEGKYVADIAAKLGMSKGDTVRKLLHDEENSPTVINFTMDEPDVRRVLSDQH